MTDNSKLSSDEIALYDRQIRLWGIDAQTRIRSSRILLVNLSSAGVEIAKNLMLSGIGHLTILDPTTVAEEDLDANFFINSTNVGDHKATASFDKIKDLNPRVNLEIDLDLLAAKSESFYGNFDLVIVTECTKEEISKLNQITRSLNIPFYATGSHGLYGYIFVDLIEHIATVKNEVTTASLAKKLGPIDSVRELVSTELKKENDTLVDINKVVNRYKPFNEIGSAKSASKIKEFFNTKRKANKISLVLPCVLALLDHYPLNHQRIDDIDMISEKEFTPLLQAKLNDLGLSSLPVDETQVSAILRQAFTQFQPTGAIIGGAVSQDVIQYLSGKQCFNNFVVLDAVESKMPIYVL